jgi:hypothetical protein
MRSAVSRATDGGVPQRSRTARMNALRASGPTTSGGSVTGAGLLGGRDVALVPPQGSKSRRR